MLDLAELLAKGYIRTDVMVKDSMWGKSPPKGHRWMILGGVIKHITGTDTFLLVRDTQTGSSVPDIITDLNTTVYQSMIDSADASGWYPVFNMVAEPYVAQKMYFPILDSWMVWLVGGLNAEAKLMVLEWKA